MNSSDLFNIKENGFKSTTNEENNVINSFCENYKIFLNISKTERETVLNAKKIASSNGFKDINKFESLKPGDKVYYVNKDKNIFLCIIGNDDINDGMNFIVSHADSPRLDLKPNPLYEEEGLAYLKTHYYGGLKKYQWTSIPLAIHGIVVKASGEKINICIGEDDNDPIFTITDLLPHLATEQMERKLKDGVSGEALNLLIGNIPISDSIKLNILKILNDNYHMIEADFISSEIEIVPAFKCRDLGFDKSMIAGYGQDDRCSVFTSLIALTELNNVKRTAICVITDKEEVGSLGNTSINTNIFDLFIDTINKKIKHNNVLLNQIYANSRMICADVDVALDPIYEKVFEKNNAAFLGKGVALSKYSGSKGKSECSDANAEYVALIRRIFEDNNILYQAGEVGKIDLNTGGSISYVFANKGIEVIDCGVAILAMHSPYEVASKYDIYASYRAYKSFYER